MADPKQSRLAAAAALRDLLNVFCGHDAPDEVLESVAANARALAAQMREGSRWDRQAMLHAGLSVMGDVTERRVSAFVHRAVAGPANPAALPIDFRRDGEAVAATVELGPMHEGAPGRAHGGVVAGLFDDLTGVVPAMLGAMSVTGRLEIDFRSPVPVETPVELRAWLHERSGRKIEVHADARHAGTLLASARALFVSIDFARIDTDLGRRADEGS
jgi:acyl-coenzyme A thioesterase PaaI-like protein